MSSGNLTTGTSWYGILPGNLKRYLDSNYWEEYFSDKVDSKNLLSGRRKMHLILGFLNGLGLTCFLSIRTIRLYLFSQMISLGVLILLYLITNLLIVLIIVYPLLLPIMRAVQRLFVIRSYRSLMDSFIEDSNSDLSEYSGNNIILECYGMPYNRGFGSLSRRLFQENGKEITTIKNLEEMDTFFKALENDTEYDDTYLRKVMFGMSEYQISELENRYFRLDGYRKDPAKLAQALRHCDLVSEDTANSSRFKGIVERSHLSLLHYIDKMMDLFGYENALKYRLYVVLAVYGFVVGCCSPMVIGSWIVSITVGFIQLRIEYRALEWDTKGSLRSFGRLNTDPCTNIPSSREYDSNSLPRRLVSWYVNHNVVNKYNRKIPYYLPTVLDNPEIQAKLTGSYLGNLLKNMRDTSDTRFFTYLPLIFFSSLICGVLTVDHILGIMSLIDDISVLDNLSA